MIEPQTPEWFQARLGRVTGSEVRYIMGSGTERLNYLGMLISEILASEIRTFRSKPTDAGIKREVRAISLYEFEYNTVRPGEFVISGEYLGCTPDGFVGKEGLIEVKSRWQVINHIMCWLARRRPDTHKSFIHGMPKADYPQVQFNMWQTGAWWCDFVSYSPEVPYAKQLYVQRVYRDLVYIDTMKQKVAAFVADLEAALEVMTQ